MTRREMSRCLRYAPLLAVVPTQSATVLVALAAIGATPLNSRAGKAIKLPPPATAFSAPPSAPATKRKMMVGIAKYQVYHIGGRAAQTRRPARPDSITLSSLLRLTRGWRNEIPSRYCRGGLCGLASICVGQNSSAPAPNPCAAKQQQQLDFWVGEWDLTWPGAKPGEVQRGTNTIRRVLEGCVVEENFSGGDGCISRGQSVSIFDTRAGKWKQTWVDNEGGYLDFLGEFMDGQMILGREATRPDGTRGSAENGLQEHLQGRIRLELGSVQGWGQELASGVADPLPAA